MDKTGPSQMADDLVVDARPAVCWLDAFPWIEAAANDGRLDADESRAWWHELINAPGTPERRQRLAQLSDLALERLTRWTIGQIFPGLAPEIWLDSLPVTTRARNVFARLGYRVAGDLMNEELGDLLSWRWIGVGTVDSILQALADASTAAASPVLLPPRQERTGRHRRGGDRGADYKAMSSVESLAEDLRLIASWYVALGTPVRSLLGNALPPGSPPEVVKARQRLEQVNASDVLDQSQAELDAAELLERCVGALDRRAQEILARRFFADRPETLDDLSRSLEITRERVRQIEAKARANLVEFLEPGETLEMISAAVRELVSPVLPLDELISLVPALAHPVEAVGQPTWRVLDRLDDGYEIADGWCASPTITGAQVATHTRLQETANAHGVVRLEDLDSLNPSLHGEAVHQALQEWLTFCGYELDGDYVFTRTQSAGDRAASILSVVGSPMDSQEILDRLGVERSLGSLKNAMAGDDRFERVDRGRWGLAEWGLESYAGVRALVRQEVARCGGQVPMDDLIERITGKYSVSASSVVTYASSPPFEAKAGIVRLASGRDVRKSPARTRRLYRRSIEWLYRIRINKEHLRGSGLPAPVAIASILNMQHGTTVQLESALGPQSVGWTGSQPVFGTIRRFLVAQDIAIGSEVFLVLGDDGTFLVEPVEAGQEQPLGKALALVGASDEHSLPDPRVALARAIGLADDSPAASVIGGYRERGDGDVAEFLVLAKDQLSDGCADHPVPSAEISEILDLL
jgi:Sigma-70, region 4